MFTQELKRVFKSLIFLALALAISVSIAIQISSESYHIDLPKPGQESYGHFLSDDLDYIFPNLMQDLKWSVEANSFSTYPYGFYREKTLRQDELKAVKNIMSDLTAKPYDEIKINADMETPDERRLEESLDKIDAILGGGSFFAKDEYKVRYGDRGMSYDEALADYNLMKEKGFDIAFARYFSDYAGIFALLLTWFMGMFFWNKDAKEGISNTLYVKNFPSFKLVFFRILAMSIALILVVWFIFTYYELQLLQIYGSGLLNPFKAYGLVFLWVFPVVFLVNTLSSLLTISTRSILLGFLGPIFSLIYIMSSSTNTFYNIGYGLIIRYNTIGNESYFLSQSSLFVRARVMWILVAILMSVVSAIVYERRRKSSCVFKVRSSNKNRVEA